MLKRRHSHDLISDDPTFGYPRKRAIFRRKHTKPQPHWVPEPQRIMSELLEFVLQHEEAFQK
jgi:charged multivesicular body protein 7